MFLLRVPLDDLLELGEDVCLSLSPEHITCSVCLDWRLRKIGLGVLVSRCCKTVALFFMGTDCPWGVALGYITHLDLQIFDCNTSLNFQLTIHTSFPFLR